MDTRARRIVLLCYVAAERCEHACHICVLVDVYTCTYVCGVSLQPVLEWFPWLQGLLIVFGFQCYRHGLVHLG